MRSYMLLLLIITPTAYSQTNSNYSGMGAGGLEFSSVPDLGDVQVDTYSAHTNVFFSLGKGTLGAGVSYDYLNFIFKNSMVGFNLDSYERMHAIRTHFFYKIPIGKNWIGTALFAPSVMSNLEEELSSEDIVFNGMLTFSKRWGNLEKNSVLTFGLGFGTIFGEPAPFPVVSFAKKINEKWQYTLGFPINQISYKINNRNEVNLKVTPKGFYGNNSSRVVFPEGTRITNTKLQYNTLQTGIEYVCRIQPNISVTGQLGYIPLGELKILDADRNELYDFEISGSPFIQTSIKFKIDKNLRNEKSKL